MKMGKKLREIEEIQIQNLKMLGEMCVNHARMVVKELGFKDESGNFDSSIGYKVFKDGASLHSGYDVTVVNEGLTVASELAEKVGLDSTRGLMLVFTVGLDNTYYIIPKPCDVPNSLKQLAIKDLPSKMFGLLSNIEFDRESGVNFLDLIK